LCRIFVLMLFAIAAFSGLAGLLNLHRWPSATAEHGSESEKVAGEMPAKYGKPGKKGSYVNIPLAYLLASATFLALSIAAGLGVRRVVRNRLRDVEFDPVTAAQRQPQQAPENKAVEEP
jgi:hypothetical protein